MPTKVTRKQVQEILNELNVNNPFSLRTVNFMDLARACPQFVIIKDWIPNPIAEKIKKELKSRLSVLVQFEAKKGVVMIG